jgi:hypothetical protein
VIDINLETITLKEGFHETREAGVCAMELVSWLAGEPHSDAPQCACVALTAYVATVNDLFNDTERQLLKPFLPRLIGTRDDKSKERSELLAFRAGNVFAPIALEIAGLREEAQALRTVSFGDWEGQKKAAKAGKVAASEKSDAASAAVAASDAAYAAYAADAAARAASYAAYPAYAASYAAASAASAAAAAATANASDVGNKDRRPEIITEVLNALEAALQIKGDVK